jgi:hypothetical protein
MSIEPQPGGRPLTPEPPHPWGEVVPTGQQALVLRVALEDRTVTYPYAELRRWEFTRGTPDLLVIKAGSEVVTIEGRELALIRAALDLCRLAEIRLMFPRHGSRPGPIVQRIAIEAD